MACSNDMSVVMMSSGWWGQGNNDEWPNGASKYSNFGVKGKLLWMCI